MSNHIMKTKQPWKATNGMNFVSGSDGSRSRIDELF